MIPALDVGHLPAAASFYSAILQPLGLRYLSTDKDPNSPATTSVVYGGSRAPAAIFQLTKSDNPKPSIVTLSAPTAEAVTQFHKSALCANPDLIGGPSSRQFFRRPTNTVATGPEAETRARITDFDGNRMDVVYLPPPGYPKGYNGSTVRRTECTTDEVSRILDWNYDVAASDKQTVVSTRSSTISGLTYGDTEPRALRRNATTAVEPIRHGSLATATREQPQTSSGWNSTAVLGTVLGTAAGVVAGAALTYSVMKGDRDRAPRQEFDTQPQSQFSRRATFPETQQQQRQEKTIGYTPQTSRLALEAPPARTVISTYSKRPVDDMGHLAGGAADDYYGNQQHDTRSRVSRYPPSAASGMTAKSRARSSSEAGGPRRPLLLTEEEHRSSVHAPSAAPTRASRVVPAVDNRTPSIAPSRVSRHTSASRRDWEKEYHPTASVHTTRAPSTYSRYEDGGRPLMANIPLDDGQLSHHQHHHSPSRAPSAYHHHDKPPTVYDSFESLHDDGRPLMANIPLDGAEVEYLPAHSQAHGSRSRSSSFSRSKPFDDFEVVAQDPAYVLDDGRVEVQSHVSSRSRRTTTAPNGSSSRPPVVGGGGGMSVAGSRYGGERSYEYANEKGQKYVSCSRAGSKVARTEVKVPNGAVAPSVVVNSESGRSTRSKRAASRSRAPTQVSARQVPLPRSRTGWEGAEDDGDSVAPSDSISCVGSRARSQYY